MIRSEMTTDIRRRLSEDTADHWLDADIYRAIDQAVITFSKEERWPWLFTEATGTVAASATTLALPSDIDVMRVFNIKLQVGSEMPQLPRRVTPSEGMRLSISRSTAGYPAYFYVTTVAQAAGVLTYTLKLVPANDTTAKSYTLTYLRRPAALSSDVEPDMPEDYQPGVVALATAYLWMHELQGADAKMAEQMALYNYMLTQARYELHSLGNDEDLVWGREQDEHEWSGAGLPRLPDSYGSVWWH